jgi:gas vesicle protein
MVFGGQTKRDGRDRGVAGLWGRADRDSRRSRDEEDEMTEEEGLGLAGVGVFLAGLLTGLAIGAGAALLYAPQAGVETRRQLVRRGRRVKARAEDAWEDLRDELHHAARRSKRKVNRAVRDGRWAAAEKVR